MKRLKKNIPDTKVRFAKINQKWKQLSFMQKEEYRRKLEETIAKYSLELQQWFQVHLSSPASLFPFKSTALA